MVKDNTFAQFVPEDIRRLGKTKQEYDLENKVLQEQTNLHKCDFLECIAKGKESVNEQCPSGIAEYIIFYRCPECEKMYYEDSPPDGIFTRMTKSKIFYQGTRTKEEIMQKLPTLFCDEVMRYINSKD